jgi:hypothetical protein
LNDQWVFKKWRGKFKSCHKQIKMKTQYIRASLFCVSLCSPLIGSSVGGLFFNIQTLILGPWWRKLLLFHLFPSKGHYFTFYM